MTCTDQQREAARPRRECKSVAFTVNEFAPSIISSAAIPFPNPISPHRRFAQSVARPIGWLQNYIGAPVRAFFPRRHGPRLAPKRAVLAPTFRFRLWDLHGANRAHAMSQRAGRLPSPLWSEDHGCESAFRIGSLAKRPEKGERAPRPFEGEGPMSLRIAIRACRRALSAEADQATQQLEGGAKAAR
jgi:hypothetical protein